jgi:hypothetical protein
MTESLKLHPVGVLAFGHIAQIENKNYFCSRVRVKVLVFGLYHKFY